MATEWDKKLTEIVHQIKKGRVKPSPVTAREFIGWFGAERRSYGNVHFIRFNLRKYNLVTKPDFDSIWIDSKITFEINTDDQGSTPTDVDVFPDPTYRIGKLKCANVPPVSVTPDAPLSKATHLMISNDYSQLPVMTNERDIKGVVSWSSIGSRLALGKACATVRECMVKHHEITADTAVLSAIDDIVRHQYVLIRNAENVITGIVTTTDLSLLFRQLAEPFLLLGEIENYIRRMTQDKYTIEELRQACEPERPNAEIKSLADLTLGEYLRLLENTERWDKLKLPIDRVQFCKGLDEVRQIRNNVMHFDPDDLHPQDIDKLRSFVRLMQELSKIGII
ncbi:MAG: CBS domain-containing protein [Dehalococcoidales bacterium]|nr:CBS domain-containing protein [Dehalococcoidales bacterium]